MNSEELQKLFKQRQSVRAYSDKPVEKEKLMRCVEAARIAPSASNAQPWKFIIIDDPKLKDEVAELAADPITSINRFAVQAPVMVAVVRERANFMSVVGQTLKNKEFPLIDIGISTIQFCLQATAEGLGTCIMGWFQEKKIIRLLHIPRNKRLELLITLGYAAKDEIRRKVRKETDEIISFNGY
jgi:nitroreductase